MEPLPWLCVGYFDKILEALEKVGGIRRTQGTMEAFKNTLEFCALHELGYWGPKFTWCNYREGNNFIKEKLDRVVANSDWFTKFPMAEVVFDLVTSSDHSTIWITLKKHELGRKYQRIFQYEESWERDVECTVVIKKEWRRKQQMESNWQTVHKNLDKCRRGLMKWQKVEKNGLGMEIYIYIYT
jgi:hypothetical protein